MAAAMPLIAPLRAALALGAAVAAAGLSAPTPATAAALVVARAPGVGSAGHAELLGDAGVGHDRDLPLAGVERVQVTDGTAGQALAELRADPRVAWAEVDHEVRALDADPVLGAQWALADIGAPSAWPLVDGSGQLVATVDTGVDAQHPDLAGRLDARGAATDPNGHGTHVAGIIAAATNNGVGVAGAAPGARLLALAALDADGKGTVSGVAAAAGRAADLGARVVNLSLGSDTASLTERAVIRAHPRTLFVAAAGNSGRDVDSRPMYPCAYPEPNVLCVGAEDERDARAGVSNAGAAAVDLFAPGVDIMSPWPGGTYARMDGTSMAAPFATAAAALLLQRNPSLTPSQLRTLLVDGSRRLPALSGLAVGGALDVQRSLSLAPAPAAAPAGTSAAPAPAAARPARATSARALSAVRLTGRLARACAPRSRACRARFVVLRFRLAARGRVSVIWQRRVCPRGRRCSWRRARTTARRRPAGSVRLRLGAAPPGRALRPGTYRLVVALAGARAVTASFRLARG